MPKAFVVPSQAPWPEDAWGIKLGSRVDGIRSADEHVRNHPERRKLLNDMGFVWDDYERRWEQVLGALRVYKEVHGDLQVPSAFVVPSQAPWPEEAWGIQLGERVSNMCATSPSGARS